MNETFQVTDLEEATKTFDPIDLFYDCVVIVLQHLQIQHPIPTHMPARYHMGSIVEQDDMLKNVYYCTLYFLYDEGIIRRLIPDNAEQIDHIFPIRRGESEALYSLTLKGLSFLNLRPSELFPSEQSSKTLGDTIKSFGLDIKDNVKKETIKQAVASGLGYAGRFFIT